MLTLNQATDGALLATYQPQVIQSEETYTETLNTVETLMKKGETLSPEEETLLTLLFSMSLQPCL